MAKNEILIGIDEAGRGPLAGPVAVGAFVVNSKEALKHFRGVKDSKQLSERQREDWMFRILDSRACRREQSSARSLRRDGGAVVAERARATQCTYAVSFSSAKIIDKHGIVKAIYSAVKRCLSKLEKSGFAAPHSRILLDGSLRAPAKYKNQKTIIGGDAKEPTIALASICAKVTRDRRMKRMGKLYPAYGFEIHKGYGTKSHYAAIKKNGACPEHRLTFL